MPTIEELLVVSQAVTENNKGLQPLGLLEKEALCQKFLNTQKHLLTRAVVSFLTEELENGLALKKKFLAEFLPAPLKDLAALQIVLENNLNSQAIKASLIVAINKIVAEKILDMLDLFRVARGLDCKKWSSAFLLRLASKIEPPLPRPPGYLVEVTVEFGKVYWRIFNHEGVLVFNRHPRFLFDNYETCRMTWEGFRKFKDAGKRKGNSRITLEKFTRLFPPHQSEQASLVFDELIKQNILTSKGRFSDAFLWASNISLRLNTLNSSELCVTKSDVINKLSPLKGKKLSEDDWASSWAESPKSPYAAKIFDILVAKGGVDANNHVTNNNLSHLSIADELKILPLNFNYVFQKLEEYFNQEASCEVLQLSEGSSLTFFRSGRFSKSFSKISDAGDLATIKNTEIERFSTKKWDVGTYVGLSAYAVPGSGLELDHVPSVAKNNESIEMQLGDKEQVRRVLADKIISLEKESGLVADFRDDSPEKVAEREKLETEIGVEKQKKAVLEEEIDQLSSEKIKQKKTESSLSPAKDKGLEAKVVEAVLNPSPPKEAFVENHGPSWFTIALSKEFHRQGGTYMLSSTEQKKRTGHPFLEDISDYIKLLFLDLSATQGDKFVEKLDDLWLALGAFRYLYRSQVKKPQALNHQYPVGLAPWKFFNPQTNSEDLRRIDALLVKSMQGLFF